jgi:hypothetical protein
MNEVDAEYVKANHEYEGYEAQAMAAGFDTSAANLKGALDRMKAGLEVPIALRNAASAKGRRDALKEKHDANMAAIGNRAKALEDESITTYQNAVKAIEYRDKKKAEVDAARAAYHAAVDNATAATNAARAANSKLSAACPEALDATYPQDARSPGNQPPGLDTFTHTSNQHREPGHSSGGGGSGGGGGMGGGMGGHHHQK